MQTSEAKPSPKNHTIKNLIEAHGWLGIIISILLFTVFWAGGVSLFRHEIQQWAELPHHTINPAAPNKPIFDIIQDKLTQYPLNTKEHLNIIMPGVLTSYYQISIDLLPKKTAATEPNTIVKEEEIEIEVDPKTGETLRKSGQLYLASFIYGLHRDLNLSQFGLYLIGVVTLFFMFAIFSGVFIHAKKLVSHLFSYRTHKQRTQLLDLHNVVGVFSLPFTLMYAITGLLFNLIIVYQISSVTFLYKGDTAALFKDVGYETFVTPPQTGVAQDMSAMTALIEKAETNYGPAQVLSFYNYGDETAVLQVIGSQPKYFGKYYDVYYQVSDGKIISQYGIETNNSFRRGLEVFSSLHFGNYAGIDLRLLYFVLAIAVAAMIIAGNFLWINKRNNNPLASIKATRLVSNLTIGVCSGLITATAAAFLTERVLPISLNDRPMYLTIAFVVTLVLVTLNAYREINKKHFVGHMLYVTTGLILLTIAADWLLFSQALLILMRDGVLAVSGVELGLLFFAIGSFWVARLLLFSKGAKQRTHRDY